jgi:uncharacterized OsmC-like protein
MTTIHCTYTGDGTTELIHGPTGEKIQTDLPADNGGKGRKFSPTDLLASAFASCVLTIMGKMAAARQETFEGAAISIDKVMAANPRRVGEFILTVSFPPHFTNEQKEFYKSAIHACPVHQTLSPGVKVTIHIK